MAEREVQRANHALLKLLSVYGFGPRELSDVVQGTLDLRELYAASAKRQAVVQNAALPEGGSMAVLAGNEILLIRAVSGEQVVTATQTYCRMQIRVGTTVVATGELPNIATASTGFVAIVSWQPALPYVLLPGESIFVELAILGTDATTSAQLRAELGAFAA